MGVSHLSKIQAVKCRPQDFLKWIEKIEIPRDLSNLLVEIEGSVRIEFKGISMKPVARVYDSNGDDIGSLEWLLEIFETKKVMDRAIRMAKLVDSEEKTLENVAKIVESSMKFDKNKTRRGNLKAKISKMEKFIDVIERVKENLRVLTARFLEEEEIDETHSLILQLARELVMVMTDSCSKFLTAKDFNIEDELFELCIPLWVYNYFTKELPKDDSGQVKFHENYRRYFFPLNFTNGVYLTTREIMDDEFLEANKALLKNNEAFITGVKTMIEEIDKPISKRFRVDFEKELTRMNWNLKPETEEGMNVICQRAMGKGLRVSNLTGSYDLHGEEKIMIEQLNTLSEFNHHWNAITRFQTLEADPVEDFWDTGMATDEWVVSGEHNLYYWVAKQGEEEFLQKIYCGDKDTLTDSIIPYMKVSMNSSWSKNQSCFDVVFNKMLRNKDEIVHEIVSMNDPSRIEDKRRVMGAMNFGFLEPSEQSFETARKILKKRNIVGPTERRRVRWDRSLHHVREYKEFIIRTKIEIQIENWLDKFAGRHEGVFSMALRTLKFTLDLAQEKEKENREIPEFGDDIDLEKIGKDILEDSEE